MKRYWDIYTAIFLAGFVSLILELSLLREFVYAFGSTATSNAIVISFFLTGLVVGSYWGAAWHFESDEEKIRYRFALVQFAMIIYIGVFYLLKKYFIYEAANEPYILAFFSIAILIPSLVGGLSFALSVKLLHPKGERYTTYIYAVSTLGSVLGSIIHGVYLVPTFGLNKTYLVGTVIATIVIFLIKPSLPLIKKIVVITAALAVCLLIYFNVADTLFNQPNVVFSKHGQYGLVEIKRVDPVRAQKIDTFLRKPNPAIAIDSTHNYYDVRINNEHQAFDIPADVEIHRIWADSTLKLYDKPVNVLVLGYASGVTAAAFLESPKVARMDVVEIAAPMIEAAQRYFPSEYKAIAEDSRAHVIVNDFRGYMRFTDKKYDIIVLDIFIHDPYSIGFYTTEFFDIVKKRMNPDGVIMLAGDGLSWSTTRLSFDYIYRNNFIPFEEMRDGIYYLKTHPLPANFVEGEFSLDARGLRGGDKIYSDDRVKSVTQKDVDLFSLTSLSTP